MDKAAGLNDVVQCPEHPGLVNDPGHFLNFIDRNCVPYTWAELFFFAGGCLLWVVAYGIIIRNTIRFRYMESAAISVCSNIAWEFIWSFPFRTDAGWFLVWTYRAWFFLDLYIFWLLIKHGPRQITQPAFRRHFTPVVVLSTLAFTTLYFFFVRQGMDTPIGSNSAYICQLILSSTCLLLLLGSPTSDGFSTAVAWLRSVGTAMNTVMMFLHYPENHVLHTMGVIAFVLDSIYIVCLARMKKRESQGARSDMQEPRPVPAAAPEVRGRRVLRIRPAQVGTSRAWWRRSPLSRNARIRKDTPDIRA